MVLMINGAWTIGFGLAHWSILYIFASCLNLNNSLVIA